MREQQKLADLPREIWVLLAANVVIALGFGLIAPALPTFARSFHVGIAAASAIVPAFAVMRLVFAPVSGRLVTALGARWVYITGLLIVAASTLACAFAQTYWQLLVFRGLGGVGSTMFTVSAMALMIRLAPPQARGTVSGYFSAGFLIGNISGPLLGSALVGFGLRLPFVVYAVALVIAVAVAATQLSPTSAAATGPVDQVRMSLRQALGHRTYRAALASNLSQGWVSMGVRVALVPLFIVDGLHSSAAMAGVVLATYAAGNVAAIVVAGRLSDRVGRRPLMLPGLSLAVVSTATLGLSESVWVAMLLTLVAGIGSGLFAPTQQAALADILDGRSGGTPLAAFQMVSDAGAVTGPILTGLVAQQWGFGWAFAVTAVVAAFALAMWMVADETAPGRVCGVEHA